MKIVTILVCVFAGASLGGGWWIYGDGVITFGQDFPHHHYKGHWVAPGIITTAGAVAMNRITPQKVRELVEGRLWLFASLTTTFIGVGLSLWIMIADDIIGGGQAWTAITLLLQNMFVLLAGLLFFLRDGVNKPGMD